MTKNKLVNKLQEMVEVWKGYALLDSAPETLDYCVECLQELLNEDASTEERFIETEGNV